MGGNGLHWREAISKRRNIRSKRAGKEVWVKTRLGGDVYGAEARMRIWHIACVCAVREQDLGFDLYHILICKASQEDCSTDGF